MKNKQLENDIAESLQGTEEDDKIWDNLLNDKEGEAFLSDLQKQAQEQYNKVKKMKNK